MRPKTIIIHDNLLKEIYFIINAFADEKIDDYPKYYFKQIHKIKFLKNLTFNLENHKITKKSKTKKILVKSNISKNRFKKMVLKAKEYIKKRRRLPGSFKSKI